ncbi:hypothetical protein GOODEAATRI_027725 [Goodea atripinnis]|uniref:Glucocorticoid receptor n=1 Tax=Goodea atripinnis TaxID=208336 RepID=A0ABV0MVP2_9TELE
MDRGGPKDNGNCNDSLTFAGIGSEVDRDTVSTASLLLESAMHLPGPGSMNQSILAPNGRGGTKDQQELGGLFESDKEGKISRMHKQEQDIFSYGDSLPLLNQSISDLDQMSTSVINASETSVLGNLPLPDLFPQQIKQEGIFSLDKELGNYSGQRGTVACNLDSSSAQLIDDADIWQDLDLSNSLSEIGAFELDSEVAHLDTILQESVVKQEKQDGASYCQSQCLQGGMSPLRGVGTLPSPLGVGAGTGYHYGANPGTPGLQDQKAFGAYSNLPGAGESWIGGKRYGDSSGIPSTSDGLPSAATLGSFPVSFTRYELR